LIAYRAGETRLLDALHAIFSVIYSHSLPSSNRGEAFPPLLRHKTF
jgi:hypothetical protein